MVEFAREKNYVNNDKVIIKTDDGQFEVSMEENDCIYIGFYDPNETHEEKTFKITKENEMINIIIDRLINSFKEAPQLIDILKDTDNEVAIKAIRRDNPYNGEYIVWYSDDYRFEDASKLIITEEEDSYNFTFVKSTSKKGANTYFVSIWGKGSHHSIFNQSFKAFYQNLVMASKKKEIQRVK